MPDGDIDSVLAALEMFTGRTVLRPAQLPTASYHIPIKKQIPRSDAIIAIQTVLALNGVGVAPQGDKFLVVTPLTLTRTTAPEMIGGSAFDQPPSGKVATKIFQLDFLRVQEVAAMLQQGVLSPNYGGPVQLINANALLVTDSVSNLQRVEALLQMVDKPATAGMKPKFYPLKFTKASDVVGKLRGILTGTLGQQLGQATSYSADDGGAQIVVVTDPRQYPLFDELIAKLDVKSNPFTKNDVIYLKHADAQQVATLLQQLVTGQTGAAQRANANALRPGQGAANVTQPIAPIVPGQPNIVQAPVTTPSGMGADALVGSNEFSSLVTVIPDIRSNAVVVSGTPDDLRLITNIVDKLDIILAQVRIEVVLAEVTLDDNHSSGISQIGATVAGDRIVGVLGTEASTAVTNGAVTYRGGTTAVSGPFDLAGTITIGTTPRKSNTAILSVPSITTTHNQEAKFFFGETRPVVTGTTSTPTAATTTSGFSTSSQVQQQEIGTTITVKPLIGSDGSVQLKIQMDISDVTGTVQIDNNAQYVIGKRTTNSFITAKSGDILYLSGMQKKKDSRSTSRLGPIPFIGDLFGSRNKDNQRTELIFFFRPTVLTNTPTDNTAALERIKDLEQRDAVMKELDPKYQPPPRTFLDKVLPK